MILLDRGDAHWTNLELQNGASEERTLKDRLAATDPTNVAGK
jgi:hypothetical protein